MLQLIKVKNFQSIKEATFELGKVTVIRGKSDVGKSAILRSLVAFFNNDFSEGYAHKGEYPFGIAIQKDGKAVIGRRTTKGVEYKFNNISHSKTNKKVPEEILSFLGIRSVQLDTDVSMILNVQEQFDAPFLLKEKSTTIAKLLGRISNLNIVMMAMRRMIADQASKRQDLNIATSHLSTEEEKLKAYSNLDSCGEILSKLKSAIDLQEADEIIISDLRDLEKEISVNNSERLEKEASILSLDSLLTKISLDSLKEDESKLEVLQSIYEERKDLLSDVALYKSRKELIESFNSEEVEADIAKYNSLILVKEFSEELSKDIVAYKVSEVDNKRGLVEIEAELAFLLKDQDICPFSGGQLYQQCKDLILKSNVD